MTLCTLCGTPVAVTDPDLIPACERCIEAAVMRLHALVDALKAWAAAQPLVPVVVVTVRTA